MDTTTKNYSDATDLLREELKSRKERNPQYSLRAFAQALAMSPAQLSQLMSGKRNFTPDVLSLIGKGLHLSPEQELQLMSATLLPRRHPLIIEKKKRQLKEDEFRLISEWYHFAILSLAKIRHAEADPHWISARLGITVSEAREALERLVRMEIIAEGKVLKQISAPLNVVSQVPSRAIQAYHNKVLSLASEKLEKTPIQKRDYSAITFAADSAKIEEARKMIEEFQDRLSDFMGTTQAKEVYVLSTQLFSLEKDAK